MTEEKKKAIYDKAYAESLEWYKNEYKKYEDCLKIPLEKRWKLIEHIKAIWTLMAECGICIYEKTERPMSDIGDIMLKFKDEGDPSSLREVLVSSHQSCWSVIKFEQTPEEIEAAARSSAQMEVETAEWKEKKEAEEAEKRRKEEEEWQARQKAEEEWRAKCKQDMDEWKAREDGKKAELEAWYDGVRDVLEKIRTGEKHWYADENLEKNELEAVEKYARTLFAFTDAQNMDCTGLELYSQNEARSNAHVNMLDVFGLGSSEHALHVTKSYDFSDDYEPMTQTYKHLPEDTVVNMLGYALVEARKMKV